MYRVVDANTLTSLVLTRTTCDTTSLSCTPALHDTARTRLDSNRLNVALVPATVWIVFTKPSSSKLVGKPAATLQDGTAQSRVATM